MSKFDEIDKKISFAEFLVGRGESKEYSLGAIKHIISAAQLLVQELTGMNQFDSKSPQIARNALIKFKEKEMTNFSNFYINLLQKDEKVSISVPEVEEDIQKLKKYVQAVRKLKER